MEPYLPTLLHSDKTGFIEGGYIGENIRLIEDVMEHKKLYNIPGIKILESEVKLNQFVDDTMFFWADLEAVKEALKLDDEFGRLSG